MAPPFLKRKQTRMSSDLILGDSHCHLSTECTEEQVEQIVDTIRHEERLNKGGFFSLMSTNHLDIEIIDQIAEKLDGTANPVVPYFGIHPWYSHLFSDEPKQSKKEHYYSVLKPAPSEKLLEVLPEPINLEEYLNKIATKLKKYLVVGVGELGLDKLFRIPSNGYYGNQQVPIPEQQVNKLTMSKTSIEHQKKIMERQLQLANEYRKPISLHCVKAPGPLFEIVKLGEYQQIPSIILHSYTGSIQQAEQWIKQYKTSPQRLFFLMSDYINGTENKSDLLHGLMEVVDDEQILVETDFGIDQFFTNGKQEEYIGYLNDIFNKICEARNWDRAHAGLVLDRNLQSSLGL